MSVPKRPRVGPAHSRFRDIARFRLTTDATSGTPVVDEARRRVQQETLPRRGHKDDPLYKIRRLLRHGVENLTARQQARLDTGLTLGDPNGEVELAWKCYQ